MNTISLKPLTPLWTGNDSGVSNQLRVTGLMGSLRWWFEGFVRASGSYACDPTENGCLHEDGKRDLCRVCWLFGTTGWSRRFRMSASGLTETQWFIVPNRQVARMHESWLSRLMAPDSKVLWGNELRLKVASPFPEGEIAEGLIRNTLYLISRFGALGAKAQNGLGAVELKESESRRGELHKFLHASQPEVGRSDETNNPKWFDLSRTVFFDVDVRDPGAYAQATRYPSDAKPAWAQSVLPIAYDIRYKSNSKNFRTGQGKDTGLRPKLKNAFKLLNIDDIVGSTACSDIRTASRVFVTHLYRNGQTWRFRIWIHIPSDLGIEIESVVAPVRELAREMFPGCAVTPHLWAEVEGLIS
jgi:CRISPR-associated protein Cmr1